MAVNQLLSQSVCVVIPILNIFSLAPKQMVLHSNERLNLRNDNNLNENETLRNINWKWQNWCFCSKAPMKKLDVHIDRSAICEPSAMLTWWFTIIFFTHWKVVHSGTPTVLCKHDCKHLCGKHRFALQSNSNSHHKPCCTIHSPSPSQYKWHTV